MAIVSDDDDTEIAAGADTVASAGLTPPVPDMPLPQPAGHSPPGLVTLPLFVAPVVFGDPVVIPNPALGWSPNTAAEPVPTPAVASPVVARPVLPATWASLPAPQPVFGDSKADASAKALRPPRRRKWRAPQPGENLGRCLLLEPTGQGASSLVYRALHRGLNIPVAVKILSDTEGVQAPVSATLAGEAALLAQLNHPNIVRVYDFDDTGPWVYLVLEFVEGLSLGELIHQSGRLRPGRAIGLMRQMVNALAAASQIGIVHRDVKPANILVRRDGTAKLADLGLAILTEPFAPLGLSLAGGGGRSPSLANVTGRDGSSHGSASQTLELLVGTVGYMSPEQARGDPVDARSDIYSLGATFYHALTGRPPFSGRNALDVMVKHAQQIPVPPIEIVPTIPPVLSDLLMTLLAKQPQARGELYEPLLNTLDTLADQLGPEALGPTGRVGSRGSSQGARSLPNAPMEHATPPSFDGLSHEQSSPAVNRREHEAPDSPPIGPEALGNSGAKGRPKSWEHSSSDSHRVGHRPSDNDRQLPVERVADSVGGSSPAANDSPTAHPQSGSMLQRLLSLFNRSRPSPQTSHPDDHPHDPRP